MSNVPDDWHIYYRTCSDCGYTYHLSGTVECRCVPCSVDGCRNNTEHTYCDDCKIRIDDLLSAKSIQWMKIIDMGYCLYTIRKQTQNDRMYRVAEKCHAAIQRLYNK